MNERLPLPDELIEFILSFASVLPHEDAQRFGLVSRQFRHNMHRLWQHRSERQYPNLEATSANWPREFHEAQKKENSKLTVETIRLFYLVHQGQTAAFLARQPHPYEFTRTDCHGYTFLDWAYMKKNQAILDYCYKTAVQFYEVPHGATDHCMNTLLHWAAYCGKTHLLKSLISRQLPIDVKNMSSETPLRIAASRGDLDMVTELLRLGANPNMWYAHDHSPLYIAVARRHLPVVKALLIRPVTEESLATVNKVVITMENETVLIRAVKNHDLPMVAELVAYGANVNQPGEFGMTALHVAAKEGHDKVMNVLLSAQNVNVNQTERFQRTPLHLAAENGHFTCVSLLLRQMGIGVDCVDEFNSTPLMYAVLSGNLRTVQCLLRHPVNLNHIARNGYTPLLAALARGHCDILQELIDHQADVNTVREDEGLTPLMFGLSRLDAVDIRAVEVMINAKNFDPHQVNVFYQKNYLHYAVDYGDPQIVGLLLDKGVNKDHPNKSGRTPLDKAISAGNEEIVALLREPTPQIEMK